MGIKQKIWAIPVTAASIFAVSVAIILTVSGKTSATISALGTSSFPYLDAVTQVSAQLDPLVSMYQGAVAEGEPKRLDETKDRISKMSAEVERVVALPSHAAAGERMRKSLTEYTTVARKTVLIILGKEDGDPSKAAPEMQAKLKALQDVLAASRAEARAEFDNALLASSNGVRNISIVILLSAAVVIGALVLASWRIISSVWSQLGTEPDQARDVMQRIAEGDLSQTIESSVEGDRNLLAAMSEMNGGLRDIVSNMTDSTRQIAQAAREIAAGNMDLSNRTEEQATAVEVTTQNMHELTDSVQNSAQNAGQARDLAATACEVAERGGVVVREVVQTMEQISSSSKRISEITSVIDGIAFQTKKKAKKTTPKKKKHKMNQKKSRQG